MNSFGQYHFEDTPFHRGGAREKLVGLILVSLFVFLLKARGLLVFSTIAISFAYLAKVPFKNIARNMRPFIFFSAFVIVMYYLFSPQELFKGFLAIWRFLLLVIFSSILLYTTSVSALIGAVESLASPVRHLNIKPRNIGVMLALTLRFIPLLFEESASVKDAIIARGGSMKKAKHIRLFISTMLGRSFQRASRVADAMVARNYVAEGNTRFVAY